MINKILSILLLLVLSFSGSSLAEGKTLARSPEDISRALLSAGVEEAALLDIREKLFITQVYDIYFNFDQYEGKAIAIEGMFDKVSNIVPEAPEAENLMVYRRSPGCCGNDGFDGFELIYQGEMPKFNDWVKVYGILRKGELNSPLPLIYLEVLTMQVLDTRGAEYVEQ